MQTESLTANHGIEKRAKTRPRRAELEKGLLLKCQHPTWLTPR
jgi:hypothetical protein